MPGVGRRRRHLLLRERGAAARLRDRCVGGRHRVREVWRGAAHGRLGAGAAARPRTGARPPPRGRGGRRLAARATPPHHGARQPGHVPLGALSHTAWLCGVRVLPAPHRPLSTAGRPAPAGAAGLPARPRPAPLAAAAGRPRQPARAAARRWPARGGRAADSADRGRKRRADLSGGGSGRARRGVLRWVRGRASRLLLQHLRDAARAARVAQLAARLERARAVGRGRFPLRGVGCRVEANLAPSRGFCLGSRPAAAAADRLPRAGRRRLRPAAAALPPVERAAGPRSALCGHE
mmetsp:Transcript_13884/g.44494  ORF Transcript_13884/g.44494 Transcript_13884/m.44494 type:complete len:293 (+) Transcript_13884:427-1305(+)